VNLAHVIKRVGRNVKRLRMASCITQEQMAAKGFNVRYYQKIEGGQANVTLDTLVKLARAFRCKLTDLVS
jgi:transcriptional regulator with XRE-family HTH domain